MLLLKKISDVMIVIASAVAIIICLAVIVMTVRQIVTDGVTIGAVCTVVVALQCAVGAIGVGSKATSRVLL